MSDLIRFEMSEKQFGVFWKYIQDPAVTDIDYNGAELWITDLNRGRFRAEEEVTKQFLTSFTHNIANAVNKQFNDANKVLEADTMELRISILHESVTAKGLSISIRKSLCMVRNTIPELLEEDYCPREVLHLLINCVQAKMRFVFGGEPGAGKTESVKFFMQFIPDSERVITMEDSYEVHYSQINPGADAVELRVTPGFDYKNAIKASLRQNTAWLMLSEVRSSEVTALLEQWSTGLGGFTTIHIDDVRKLPDRILNMMDDVNDADRMENRIYESVNVGVLIRKMERPDGSCRRYIDQMCFFARENEENRVYMIVKDRKLVSKELPKDIADRFRLYGVKEPFRCEKFEDYIREGK